MHSISTFNGLPVCSTMVQLSFKVITTLQRERFRCRSHSADTAIQAAQIAWPISSQQLQLRQSPRPEGVTVPADSPLLISWFSTFKISIKVADFNLLYGRTKEGGGINYNNLILKPLREKTVWRLRKCQRKKKSRQMFPLKSKGSSTCACKTARHQPLATETPSPHTKTLPAIVKTSPVLRNSKQVRFIIVLLKEVGLFHSLRFLTLDGPWVP